MSNTYVGIDIGFDSIKLVELKRRQSGLVVSNVLIEPCLSRDIKDFGDENLFEAIESLFTENKINPSSVVLSVSGQSLFTRFIKLPTLDKSKIDQIVQYEAQQQVPFPIDDVIWDYQLIGDWEKIDEVDEANIVLVASKKEMINNLISHFQALKIDIEYIDTSSFSLCNCIKFNDPVSDGCSLILDIGAKSTDMIVLEDDNIWCRSIPIAGNSFTQAVAKEFKISFCEAEKLKKETSVLLYGKGPMIGEAPERLRISRALSTSLSRLLAEVSRSIGFYRTHSGGGGVRNIYLCGGSSAIKNIDGFFQSKFNINVRKLKTVHNLDIEPAIAEKVEAKSSVIGAAVGVALRQATRCVMEINLLPKKLTTQRDIARKKSYIIGCFVLIGVLIISGIFYYKQWIQYEKNVTASLLNDLKQIKRESRKMDSAKRQVSLNHKNLIKLQRLQDNRTFWVRLLTELQDVIPQDCWLKRFTVRKSRGKKKKLLVRISGETTAPLGEIPKIKEALEQSNFFSNVKIRTADDLTIAGVDSKNIRRFEMTCELNKR